MQKNLKSILKKHKREWRSKKGWRCGRLGLARSSRFGVEVTEKLNCWSNQSEQAAWFQTVLGSSVSVNPGTKLWDKRVGKRKSRSEKYFNREKGIIAVG